jgi:succinate dehydrogenase/fumarate reductase flavoprotein subunit
VEFDTDQIDSFMKAKHSRLDQSGNPIPVEEFEYKVRRIINDYIRPPKNEYKLNRALWWMDRFRQELTTMVRVKDMHDLFKVYEVENIIQCATLSALASKERKESRWGLWHHRSDYPDKDDKKWLKHIVLTAGDRPENVEIAHKKIVKLEKESQ